MFTFTPILANMACREIDTGLDSPFSFSLFPSEYLPSTIMREHSDGYILDVTWLVMAYHIKKFCLLFVFLYVLYMGKENIACIVRISMHVAT